MSSLTQTAGVQGPTLDQVRDKIEARYAKAVGTSELTGATVESRMLEVEQASIGAEAKSRLDSIRAEMGALPASSAPASSGELGAAGTPSTDQAPAAPTEAPADNQTEGA